jgi:uncharacterized protein
MTITPDQQDRINALCRRYGVARMRLFGSTVVGSATPQSDVDVMLEFASGHAPSAFALIDLQDALSAVFEGRPVDIAFAGILNNPYRRRAIEPQLQTVFEQALAA